IGALWGRGFIDLTWTIDAPGYTLDLASVLDLAPEFALGGAGLGTIKLDAGQAPVRLDTTDDTSYTFRYWTTGQFAADAGAEVTIEFIPGSWSFNKSGADLLPTATSVTLDNAQWITIDFDNVPAGFAIDPASILDLAPEFTLSYSGQNAAKTGAGSI